MFKSEKPLSYKPIWMIWLFCILGYGVISRVAQFSFETLSVEGEVIRSIARLAVVIILLITARHVIASKSIQRNTVKSLLFLVSLFLFLSVPFLISHNGTLDPIVNVTFAITSIIVGLHEEIVFRAILQNYLLHSLGEWQSILLTSVIFTVWHIGVIDPYISLYVHVAFASLILGIIYAKTQSLILVVILHSLYDAISFFTGNSPIISYSDGVIIIAISFICIVFWGRTQYVSSKAY